MEINDRHQNVRLLLFGNENMVLTLKIYTNPVGVETIVLSLHEVICRMNRFGGLGTEDAQETVDQGPTFLLKKNIYTEVSLLKRQLYLSFVNGIVASMTTPPKERKSLTYSTGLIKST